MLFTGTSEHAVDAKLRLAIPAKYRNQWDEVRDGGAWFCVPWPSAGPAGNPPTGGGGGGNHLRLYTEAAFTRLADQLPATLAPNPVQADFDASFFGYAERLEMDTAGRIMLPKLHVQLTTLPTDVVIVGARTHLEVRGKDEWLAGHANRFPSLPDLAQRIDKANRTNPAKPS